METLVRAAFLVPALLAGVVFSSAGRAQQAPAPLGPRGIPGTGSDNSANGNSPAANKAAQDAIPLTPAMIEELGRRFNASRRAEEEATTEQIAAPINRQVNVSFAPGAATSILNTVRGYPTAVSFFDSTGQPWPIAWDTNSNPSAVAGGTNCNLANSGGGVPSVSAFGFYVCTPTKGSNVLEIQPISAVPRGGLVVSLEGAPKPITFLLVSGGGRYDANLSVHVADRGPHAKIEIMTQPDAPDTGAPFLTGMLDGVPPADAVPLSVEGVSPEGLRAWRLGRNVYLRTRYTLLSPEWTASEAEGGLTVYAVPNTPVVLLSVNGRTVSAALKE
ncbi:MAG: type IV secretion protein DotH [Alphaproteobacteria bacterium]|nr:type IV secretion protein DotH [Alphaproteobacteria bacterium]